MSRRILAFLSVAVILCLATVLSPQALSQDVPRLVLPRVDSESPSDAPQRRLTLPLEQSPPVFRQHVETPIPQWQPTSAVPVRNENADGCTHWIASVRHCQQLCARCSHCCRLAFSQACSLDDASPAHEAEFRRWLRPGVPICIMIHGSYFPAENVAEDCGDAVCWLRQGSPHVQYVCFTWPSEGIFTLQPGIAVSSLVPSADVAILGRRAELNGIRLAHFIQSLPAECPVSIVAHSHGARISATTLHLLGGGAVGGIGMRKLDNRRIRAVMVAAAVDHDWLNPTERYGRALCATECLLNLRSEYDWALSFYPLRRPFSRTALGRTGFTRADINSQGERAQKLAELDVSDLIGAGHIFPHYYRHPQLSMSLAPYVGFTE